MTDDETADDNIGSEPTSVAEADPDTGTDPDDDAGTGGEPAIGAEDGTEAGPGPGGKQTNIAADGGAPGPDADGGAEAGTDSDVDADGNADDACPIPFEATTGGTDPDRDRPTAPSAVVPYRHDVHKLRATAHAHADGVVAGVPVNEPVPLGADGDAALLSRPAGDPEPTMANHTQPTRLSRIAGEPATATPRIEATTDGDIAPLVTPTDAQRLHARWLTSPVAAAYAESAYYPYTSLQYHTLVVAALHDAYQAGYDFADVSLVATPTPADVATEPMTAEAALAADGVEPHRTVLWTPACTLHLTPEPGDRPAASLGAEPAKSFADTWSRLPAHPIDTEGVARWRTLDAHLRRIRSWSTALAFLDDYVAVYGPTATGDV